MYHSKLICTLHTFFNCRLWYMKSTNARNKMVSLLLHDCVISFRAVAFMRFTLAAYSQNESNTTLSVNLVLDPFGGTGTGPQSITQDILEAITALVPAGDTATGK